MTCFARITLSISGLIYLLAGLIFILNDYRFRSIYSSYGLESHYLVPGIIDLLIGIMLVVLIVKK